MILDAKEVISDVDKYMEIIEKEGIILQKDGKKIAKIVPIRKRRRDNTEEVLKAIKELTGIAKELNMDADAVGKERILGSD
ncbi:hypothetical protein Csac_0208 [Caldicellulosiruptor saccharolyticus DSM 8903]|uniref:Antitoxin n=1 Tax=Caldicellulosiruptor saccharolyticus (strain ATCC 43494 / DSM 8903 / Tp8T 6331) TaxID=351627 RepID=A4XG21_CALS8|nr:hypothetical protein [Caldicellulosiruptor saccharolyticus]ABP65856.1 hypothetical protein Csac_0208 [Caldicellulosiruptor saccharolyticus DSM 8903]